jgi:hypothetical protein
LIEKLNYFVILKLPVIAEYPRFPPVGPILAVIIFSPLKTLDGQGFTAVSSFLS